MCSNRFLDPQNIVNDTKIKVLSEVLAALWTKYILMAAIFIIFLISCQETISDDLKSFLYVFQSIPRPQKHIKCNKDQGVKSSIS